MRVTAAFSRLLQLDGVWVRAVRFERRRVVVEVALRRRRLLCPECGYSTPHRHNVREVQSDWRHLDLGVWRLEIRATLRRLSCPTHGVRTEGVPFARPGSDFTRDFEQFVAWLAAKTDQSAIERMLRVNWRTVGRIIERVTAEELDPNRLEDLADISIDEVSWRKGHRYLTLVGDHRRRQVVWGCDGAGSDAADRFFAELDPPASGAAEPEPAEPGGEPAAPERPEVAALPATEPTVGERAAKLEAISMDMGPGYAKSAREHAPQAIICIDPYHVIALANKALDEVRRAYWNELRQLGDKDAAKEFKQARWALLKNPDDLTDQQAETLAALQADGGTVARAYTLKEALRAILAPGITPAQVAALLTRFCSRASRSRMQPFVRLARTIRKHRQGILAAVRLKVNNARHEALNNKARLVTRRAYGFHTAQAALALIMLTCGPITLMLPHEDIHLHV
jgi:transposase